MSASSAPEVAVSDAVPDLAPDDAFSLPPADHEHHPDARDSARMWSEVSRFAPATSPYARARAVCLSMVRPRMPTDSAASLECVPPKLWRFLGEQEQTEPSDQIGDLNHLMRAGPGDH
jgi:hypothetical protein